MVELLVLDAGLVDLPPKLRHHRLDFAHLLAALGTLLDLAFQVVLLLRELAALVDLELELVLGAFDAVEQLLLFAIRGGRGGWGGVVGLPATPRG